MLKKMEPMICSTMFGGDNGQESQIKSILGPGKEIVMQ